MPGETLNVECITFTSSGIFSSDNFSTAYSWFFPIKPHFQQHLFDQTDEMKKSSFSNCVILFFIASGAGAVMLNFTTSSSDKSNIAVIKDSSQDRLSTLVPKSRRKRYISQSDMIAILDYHNKVRANVFPPAANMEYMVSFLFNAAYQQTKQLLEPCSMLPYPNGRFTFV